jgi:LacI family transcriptional regulator
MPTIRNVAKHAGVAPITVSRVINNSGYVSKETRARVEAAIEELGYVPNMLGPSLRFQKTMTLAAVLTDITNPFWTTVMRGIEDVAQANGYSTILCNTDESEEKQDQYLQMLLRRRIDGILLVPASSNPDPIRLIQKQDIPVVILDRHVPDVNVDIVRADSEEGAFRLTQHLLSLGHKQISVLSGPKSVSTAVDRVDGYCRAVDEAGLDVCDSQVIWGKFTQESGYRMTQKALNMSPRPTALFAANNFIAIGAMRALREADLNVPDDISLVAMDDIPTTFIVNPFITVATQPSREMGRKATQLLLERMEGEVGHLCREVVLSTDIVIRTSSGTHIVT